MLSRKIDEFPQDMQRIYCKSEAFTWFTNVGKSGKHGANILQVSNCFVVVAMNVSVFLKLKMHLETSLKTYMSLCQYTKLI